MMHKSLKLALVGLLVASSASAISEWRSPWITERGPIRYTFEKLNKDKSDFNMWWAGHYKGAHKAFLKHSTKNVPLTALMFNKSDFTMNEIFPNCKVPMGTEEYSPYLRLTKFSPRANYSEFGFTFGGRWDYPVWDNKGRIGLRASVPFRQIKIEREDFRDNDDNPAEAYMSSDLIRITRNSPVNDINKGAQDALNAVIPGAAAPANDEAARAAVEVAPGDIAQKTTLFADIQAAAPAEDHGGIVADVLADANVAISEISTGNDTSVVADYASADAINAADVTASQVVTYEVANLAISADVSSDEIIARLTLPAVQTRINAAADRGDSRDADDIQQVLCTAYNLAFVAAHREGPFK